MNERVKEKMSLVQLILIYLSKRGCLTLEELEKYTNADRNVLLVTLTRLHKKGLIYRKAAVQLECGVHKELIVRVLAMPHAAVQLECGNFGAFFFSLMRQI